ncbi:hypothetical protein NEIMUCOT_03673 [Neisseria mucosa ATCC 25996]|uniref:Uncharacterized protein n=1 Tax=Neisseria mucosa (strain ATCC 25996 / DSM 4631 / NCTC 10774 / M26) TaxID=546266 RepID=D2ZSU1_NEIM2|nr:hypothetical protein NEIMUCOT_03673 [Neisseria mucosa ATCC 25996]
MSYFISDRNDCETGWGNIASDDLNIRPQNCMRFTLDKQQD